MRSANIDTHFWSFNDRPGRYTFLRDRFKHAFEQSKNILDVGCDENYLKSIYGERVYGVDVAGAPDRVVDLEKEKLSFIPDASYDLVICTEVLEHIENLHEMFDEIIRVSAKYIIVSLPNCSSTRRMLKVLLKGRNGKFYGLPFEKPADRHKWFFSYKEIIDFVNHKAKESSVGVDLILLHYNVRHPHERNALRRMKQWLESLLIRLFRWDNQCQDVIFLLQKYDRV